MAIAMREKYNKYWGDVDKMNKLIYVAAILDPHYKMLVVGITPVDMFGVKKGKDLAENVEKWCKLSCVHKIRYEQKGITGVDLEENIKELEKGL
ncbi:unnamed protein product [Cuscuta campestris]|uniref:hAT-like transposase RNase-H fold domain-containing protein n=1 Tax=Cuscuta campestris TaxID=132261 RepID=A0A484KI25_9ASTE|nr:unnamed protein product [Cuscuta campestris]